MEIYFLLFIWTIFSGILLITKLKDRKILFCVANAIVLVLVATLRADTIGTDYRTYINIFKQCNDMFNIYYNEAHIEIGYLTLNYIIRYFTESEIVFTFIIATVIYALFNYSFYKYSDNILLSLLILQGMGMYCASFNIVRQYVAVAILGLAYNSLIKEEYRRYFLFCVIASTFHRSALIMLPLLFVYKYLKNIKYYYILSTFLVICSWCCVIGYKLLITYIPKYQMLYGSSIYAQERPITAAFYLGVIVILCWIYFNLLFVLKNQKFDRVKTFNSLMILLYGIVWIASFKVFILHRLIPYFEIMICYIIPSMIESTKRKWLFRIISINLLVMYYYLYLAKNMGEVVPYILNNKV